jgi:hypothetical protein
MEADLQIEKALFDHIKEHVSNEAAVELNASKYFKSWDSIRNQYAALRSSDNGAVNWFSDPADRAIEHFLKTHIHYTRADLIDLVAFCWDTPDSAGNKAAKTSPSSR